MRWFEHKRLQVFIIDGFRSEAELRRSPRKKTKEANQKSKNLKEKKKKAR